MPLASPPPPGSHGPAPRPAPQAGSHGGERPLPSPPPPGSYGGASAPPSSGARGGEQPLASPPPPGTPFAGYSGPNAGAPGGGSHPAGHAPSARGGPQPTHGPGAANGPADPTAGLPETLGTAFWHAVARAVQWSRRADAPPDAASQPPTPPPPVIAKADAPQAPEEVDFPTQEPECRAEEVVLQVEAENLRTRLERGRKRRARLATAAVAVVALSGILGVVHYVHRVLSYAELAPGISIRVDPLDPERLTLSYRPVRAGRVGFHRWGAERRTELVDEVSEEAVGQDQMLLWQAEDLTAGDRVGVRYRDGWRLTTHEIVVPEHGDAP